MQSLLRLLRKYKGMVAYVLFGAVTTAANLAVYYLCYNICGMGNDLSVVLSWVAAVLVAFLTNKPFVFESHDWSPKVLFPEMLHFFGCRLGTGVLELVLMHVTVEILNFPGFLMKLLVNVVVIILNYVASKLLVFRNK
jgi:putative flippase GtrA